jgi:6-pyruvoyltetrahydropterin/6-carboxytetrahydropterin synthase
MISRIYKQVHFDASHRLLHYEGKCANLHGHRWLVEVWLEGSVDGASGILVDYNEIKAIVDRLDHQIILNEEDPMVPCIGQFQTVITTSSDPTSEVLAKILMDQINDHCDASGRSVHVVRIRVWESDTCYAEIGHEGS